MATKHYLSAPNDVCISVTKQCNLRCKHCCTNVQLDDRELTIAQFIKILDELKEAKVFRLQIMGGEPFVKKDIFKFLRAAKQRKFAISINTNCTLITDEIVENLAKLSPIGIATSLDGSCAEIHDKLRGNGSFEKAVEGIRRLVARGFKIPGEAVVTKLNIHDLPNIAETARKLGLSRMVFVPIFHGGQAKCFINEIAPDDEEYSKGIPIVKELRARFGNYVGGSFIQCHDKMLEYRFKKPKKGQKANRLSGCSAASSSIAIRSDGQVVPCGALWDIACGSLLERSLADIWNNSPVLNKFRAEKRTSLSKIEGCQSCDLRFFCTGNCRASAYYRSGSIKGFSPDCNYFAPLKTAVKCT